MSTILPSNVANQVVSENTIKSTDISEEIEVGEAGYRYLKGMADKLNKKAAKWSVPPISIAVLKETDIPLKGKVLDKHTGRGVLGLSIYDTQTSEDGSFSAVGDRAHFHETCIYLRNPIRYVIAKMKNHMTEELAQQLQFHIDPNSARTHVFLEDDNDDGIFCDYMNCAICDSVEKAPAVGVETKGL